MFDDKQTYLNAEAADKPLENPVAPGLVETVRLQRLAKLRRKIAEHDCAGILLYDPLNIRYATDTSNMQVWTLHNPIRYAHSLRRPGDHVRIQRLPARFRGIAWHR